MEFRVTLRPSGQTFIVEHHESVLDAAIRAGIPLDYGCSGGNCGLCKARVIEGQVERIQHHDYVIPKAEQLQGVHLMCSNTAAGDLVIEASVAERAEDIDVREFKAKTRKLVRISDDLLILYLQTPRTSRLRFLAGQYATLSVAGAGELDASIASCPCDDRRLEFHIRRCEDEPFSAHVFNELTVGDWIDVQAPKGDFVLHEDVPRPVLLIAFDTGFAAVKSLLEHATAQEQARGLYLYWIACGCEGPYLDNLCRSWEDALDEFYYTPLSISTGYGQLIADQQRGVERVEQQLLKVVQDHPDVCGFDAYVAGPELVLETARRLLLAHGLPEERLTDEPVRGNHNVSCIVLSDNTRAID